MQFAESALQEAASKYLAAQVGLQLPGAVVEGRQSELVWQPSFVHVVMHEPELASHWHVGLALQPTESEP